MTGSRGVCAVLVAILAFMAAGDAGAQIRYGKNKVVYADREWQVFEEGQVHLYFYEEEEDLARQTLAMAVDAYADFVEYFGFEFEEPIPIILYGTHHDFKQTHVTPGFVSDGTAGFTEFAKGRIAIRATGNYGDLLHLVRHEMVHAFMLSELAKVMNDHGIYDYAGPPLWFIEGLAENIANPKANAQAHMFLRDSVLNDRLLPIPEMWRIRGSFLMYKMGESIVGFLRDQYGDHVPALLIDHWWLGRGFEDLLQLELGLTLQELSDRWVAYLKRRYFPELLVRRSPAESGDPVVKKPQVELAPTVVSNENDELELVALSYRGGTLGLWRIRTNADHEESFHQLIESARTARFETLPSFRSRLDTWGGQRLTFVAKSGGQDALYIYDLIDEKIENSFSFPNLREISSPTFSPDGNIVAFSALSAEGYSDLYVVELDSRRLRRITHDLYHDIHPDWHPERAELVFASDRHSYEQGTHDLYRLELAAGARPQPMVRTKADETEPVWSPDGESVLYVSTSSDARNLHVLSGGKTHQITNLTGGTFFPDWIKAPSPDEPGEIVASVFHQGTFHLYRFPVQLDARGASAPVTAASALVEAEAQPEVARLGRNAEARKYNVSLGLDFVQTVAVVDPDLPYSSGASLGFSDLLGEHQLSVSVSNSSNEFNLKDMNVGVGYSNFSRRWNRHLGMFRFNTLQNLNSLRPVAREERRTGVFAGLTYPFSTFKRVEFSTVMRYLERNEQAQAVIGKAGSSWLWSAFASYVYDNSLWTWQGPLRGKRYAFTVGQTFDLLGRGFDRQTAQLDYRHYLELWRQSSIALRWNQRHSFGSDTSIFYVGGPNDLRGYDWFEFFGDQIYLGNLELRVPLIDHLLLRFPFGRFDVPNIRGAAFFDVANVEGPFDTGWIGSFGYSFYLTLFPPLVVRMDVVKTHDFDEVEAWDVDWNLSFLF